jgi:hypothetical protein
VTGIYAGAAGWKNFTGRALPGRDGPSVNRQVIGSGPIAGATWRCHRQPPCLRKRRKRGNPHDAGSARGLHDPHKIPTTGPPQARPPRRAGEGRAPGPRRERPLARGHLPGCRALCRCCSGARWARSIGQLGLGSRIQHRGGDRGIEIRLAFSTPALCTPRTPPRPGCS